ncbi:Glycine cleavage system H protein [Baekduia alba]|uniref:SCP2 sterol-binding domain-containing protein n=1 Tax=Baekduia alba TaxID=2997333 RepID=UPI0023414E63|nr:SCP2 sterol-binding domain-containing protein [Baekduia alba]WCB93591.1 Glycine cleavage system H protein [Baekduia alba]
MPESAPDFVEAVVGYRAWHIEDDGLLRPWTFTALPWEPGANRAVCARDVRHMPPVADCMCGLYALTDPGDRRLDFRADQAVGAIAAWGDLEVHRTGFRAEQACVTALALPDRAGWEQRDALARAAERYGVPLVAPDRLSDEALRHGATLPDDLWTPSPTWPARRAAGAGGAPVAPRLPAVDPAAFGTAARGIALDAHLWVETALGAVVVGLTRALAADLGGEPQLTLPTPGASLEAGDLVATVRVAAGTFGVWAPVGGSVLTVNPRLADDPGLLARDPEGAGWLLRLAPRDWEREAGAVTWGAAADRHYAALLERDAARGDAFADVRLERLRALPPVRNAADVLAHLRAEREAPRFADADAVHVELGGRLRDALANDPPLRERLGRLDTVVRFALREPDATLVLDLRDGRAHVAGDAPAGGAADLELACTAEDAYRWFIGKLDPASALRCGDVVSSEGPGATLRTLAVLKHLRIAAWDVLPTWAR